MSEPVMIPQPSYEDLAQSQAELLDKLSCVTDLLDESERQRHALAALIASAPVRTIEGSCYIKCSDIHRKDAEKALEKYAAGSILKTLEKTFSSETGEVALTSRIKVLENAVHEASERLRGASNHIYGLSKDLGIEVTHNQSGDTADALRKLLRQGPKADVAQVQIWGIREMAMRRFVFSSGGGQPMTEADIENYCSELYQKAASEGVLHD